MSLHLPCRPRFRQLPLLLFLATACLPPTLHAHMGSTSYLTLRIEGDELRGQWDMALIDLDLEVELDANADNTITEAEFGARRREAEGYAVTNVLLAAGGSALPLRFTDFLREEFTDGSYAVLGLVPGSYDVKAEALGFDATTVAGKTVAAGSATAVDVKLTPN